MNEMRDEVCEHYSEPHYKAEADMGLIKLLKTT